jgi:hypothetical protein
MFWASSVASRSKSALRYCSLSRPIEVRNFLVGISFNCAVTSRILSTSTQGLATEVEIANICKILPSVTCLGGGLSLLCSCMYTVIGIAASDLPSEDFRELSFTYLGSFSSHRLPCEHDQFIAQALSKYETYVS